MAVSKATRAPSWLVTSTSTWAMRPPSARGMALAVNTSSTFTGAKWDGARHADGVFPLGIHGKRERAVGQRVCDGAVGDPKPVDHVLAHCHAAKARTRSALHHLDTQPLAEGVLVHHLGHYGVHVGVAHGRKVRVRCT